MAPHAISFSRGQLMAPPTFVTPPPPFTGQTFFMAPGGSDGNPGSELSPVFTWGRACQLMSPGDRTFTRGGTFLPTDWVPGSGPALTGGTSWATAKIFQNYPGETSIFQPQLGSLSSYFALTGTNCKYIIWNGETDGVGTKKIIFDGSDCTGINLLKLTGLNNVSFLRFQGVICRNSPGGQGILVTDGVTGCELIRCRFHNNGSAGGNLVHGAYWAGDTGIITGCEFDHNGSYGMQLYHDSGSASVFNNIVYGNLFHDNAQNNPATTGGGGELLVAAGDNNLIYNNVIYAGRNEGLAVYFRIATTNTLVYYNTIYGSVATGLKVYPGCTGTILRNNVSYLNGTNYTDGGTGTTADHNSTSGTDPQFQAPGSANFHLQSGSPLRGQGVAVAGISTDFDGVARGNPPDIGAYQYV